MVCEGVSANSVLFFSAFLSAIHSLILPHFSKGPYLKPIFRVINFFTKKVKPDVIQERLAAVRFIAYYWYENSVELFSIRDK